MKQIALIASEKPDADLISHSLFRWTYLGDGQSPRPTFDQHNFDAVVISSDVPPETIGTLFNQLENQHPAIKRALWAPYDALPGLVQNRIDRLSHRILPLPIKKEALDRALTHLLDENIEDAPDLNKPLDWSEAVSLLQRTARDASHISNTAIRPFTTDGLLVQMQIVLPSQPRKYELFRASLRVDWQGPIRPSLSQRLFSNAKHPVLRAVGTLYPQQELYVRKVGDDEFVYALLLPWQRQERTTLVLGVLAQEHLQDAQSLMQTLHQMTLEELSQFFVQLSEEVFQYATEYDWIVTDNYVGPDRRGEPTSFVSRHVFSGRRRTILPQLKELSDWFVDRFDGFTLALFLICILLSFSDTVLTFAFVVRGQFNELNPLMAYLIELGPWAFASVKTLMSAVIIWSLGRFQYVRAGRPALILLTAGYTVLNLYWLVLLI
jgi:hypothetical protein